MSSTLRQTSGFVDYLARVVQDHPLDFRFQKTTLPSDCETYSTLHEALVAYAWPAKKVVLDIPGANPVTLQRHSSFEDNKKVLDQIQAGLRRAMVTPDEDLFEWIATILIWGGVYTRRGKGGEGGNRGWLEAHRGQLRDLVKRTAESFQDDTDNFSKSSNLHDLRFNAGFTKVYALLLDDFIIYDSRVAAALAWLVCRWEVEENVTASELLLFACMPANQGSPSSDASKMPKVRRPNAKFLQVNNRPHIHAMWNVRANWIIRAVTDKVAREGRLPRFKSAREIEAALFMMGADLRNALPLS